VAFLRSLLLSRPASLVVLALLYALLNAPKPLVIDDGAYYYFARHIASDPLRPYDFQMFWYQIPDPAIEILAPPGLLYWWAIAYRLFGEQPFMWKLWLLPYCLLFVFALDALFRRFARGLERPLVWMTVLSPLFLPSLNLMLDVPALALSLGAVALFFRAAAKRSFGLALLAGVLAGVGMETKYTGFLAPAVILVYAGLFRRPYQGMMAALMAWFVFSSWEGFIALKHKGQSHFMVNFLEQMGGAPRHGPAAMSWHLILIIGAVAAPVGLLGLTALRVWGWVVAAVGAILAIGFVLVAKVDANWTVAQVLGSGPWATWQFEDVLFGGAGLLTAGVTAVAVVAVFFRSAATIKDDGRVRAYPVWLSPFRRLDLFVVLWLCGEVLGHFQMTPFPAVRRTMGVVVVGILLAGRLAARRCRTPSHRSVVYAVVAGSILLGLGYYRVDMVDAFAEKDAAEEAAAFVRSQAPEARIWYTGHWGFQYYAEQAGMEPVIPNGYVHAQGSVLHQDDWLVAPDFLYPTHGLGHLIHQDIAIDPTALELVEVKEIHDGLPLATVMGYYGGWRPLHRLEGPRVRVRIYRVIKPEYRPWGE
jgi:hypothetical protein